MSNKMAEAAKLLGIDIGEKFEICGNKYNPYVITNKNIKDARGCTVDYKMVELLRSPNKLIQIPYRPSHGEIVYFIGYNGQVLEDIYDESRLFHRLMATEGYFFKTKTKAKANKETILKKLGLTKGE